MVAVFGAIIPSAAASLGVIDGIGGAASPFEAREKLRPPAVAGGTVDSSAALGAPAVEASSRGCVESPGAMSVESDIMVSAAGPPAPGGAEARAPAWRNGITAAISPAKRPPPIALAMRLLSPPGAAHWHWSCAYTFVAGTMRTVPAASARSVKREANGISTFEYASGRYNKVAVPGQLNI